MESPRSTCSRAAGIRAGLARAPLLRPSADLEGPASAGRAASPRATPTRSIRMPRPGARSSSANRAACRPCAKTRRRSAGRHAETGGDGRQGGGAVRGIRAHDRAAADPGVGPPSMLLHGHCHQKSMGLVPAAKSLLSMIPGRSRSWIVDSGCCGMAGSWGYTRDHFEVSRAIGERRLFPAVRGRQSGAVVAAAGTSCRHQIRDFTGVDAVHPAVLLRSLLDPKSIPRARPVTDAAISNPAAAPIHPTTSAWATSTGVARTMTVPATSVEDGARHAGQRRRGRSLGTSARSPSTVPSRRRLAYALPPHARNAAEAPSAAGAAAPGRDARRSVLQVACDRSRRRSSTASTRALSSCRPRNTSVFTVPGFTFSMAAIVW